MKEIKEQIKNCVSELQPLCNTEEQYGALYFLVNIAILCNKEYDGLPTLEIMKKHAEDMEYVVIESDGDRIFREMCKRWENGQE